VKQKLHITFTTLLIVVGVYILFTDYDPQTQGQSIILAFSIILLMMVLFLHIKGDFMAEEKKEINPLCKELEKAFDEFQGKLSKFDTKICEGLNDYMFLDIHNVKLTKKEFSDIIKKCDFIHSLKNYNKITSQDIQMYLNGAIDITKDASRVIKDISLLGGVFPKGFSIKKAGQYITKEELETVTPLFVKEFIKAKKWTYKDLAEAIGAGESTLKAWISKGTIPEWAKRTILLMQKVDRLSQEHTQAKSEAYTIKERLQDFKELLSDI